MTLFRHKYPENATTVQVTLEAFRWFKNGDHPQDEVTHIRTASNRSTTTEGKVVGYFHLEGLDPLMLCPICGQHVHKHGLLQGQRAVDASAMVCPGDWIEYSPITQYHIRHNDAALRLNYEEIKFGPTGGTQ